MKTSLVFLLTAASGFAGTGNFDKSTGAPPKGWTSVATGSGTAKWTVEKDDSAPSKPNVLKQSGESDYPIILNDGSAVKDGFAEVKGRALDGKEDQAIGVAEIRKALSASPARTSGGSPSAVHIAELLSAASRGEVEDVRALLLENADRGFSPRPSSSPKATRPKPPAGSAFRA